LNKDSTGSNYRSRAKRTRKNKTALIILQAAAAFLIILSGILYSIYATQSGSGQKQTEAVNVPASNEPAENAASTNDGATGNEQIGSSNAPVITSVPGEVSSNNTEPEPSAEVGQGVTVDPVGSEKEAAAPKQENNGGKASEPAPQKAILPTTYVVRAGDTLSTISMKFYHSKLHVSLLAEQNDIVFINDMNVGDTIKIPALSEAASAPEKQQVDYSKVTLPVTYLVRTGDTLYNIATQFYHSKDYVDLIAEHNKLDKTENLKAGTSLNIPAIPVTNPAGADNSTDHTAAKHTVQQGETLSSIARKYYGSSKYAMTIAEYNHLADDDDVRAGDVLKIPPAATS
jgi:nucleoid-associated protein YgaU